MGLVRFGGGVIQISGSIAGTVHARNRFGNYIRPRTKPVNPRTPRQEAVRAIVSFLAEYWHQDLSVVERGLWDTYAAAVPMKNRLGETIHPTGFNHFIRTNSVRMSVELPVLDAAPSVLSLPEKDVVLACSEEDIAGQTFTFLCENDGWAANGDPKLCILIAQGRPQLVSRNSFFGPWRHMGVVSIAEGTAGTSTEPASFSFALGQKVWFLARVLTVSGRLSQPWQLDPRTIIADV